ncbi:ABC transporter ATP-binding protein [Haloarchaeobius sp. HME9146]|uniref:ABC transporter ATP-binding protein n=1 Tax=Haloarchaeobius sp. HME9146 TaxID=2978732 RepID=UPI0021C1C435|nr:ABC transporter ATP-binding protein [Haloarchaeobius sp. HME9146]MCT9097275.1 ABC transporter ATP-binding protein/permease [Haloarchaeobius sp. HME9146]
MASSEDTPFDQYRADVDRPLLRLFREYGIPRLRWFTAGNVANLVGRSASLLPPLVLGTAIDAIFTGDGSYSLPLVPAAWLPTEQAAQFWFSVALIVVGFAVTGIGTFLWGVTMNRFAHGVMHEVRTDTFAAMQALDMAFFDDKQTGEVMSVLNNDASNLETFLDDALSEGLRIVVMVLGIAGILIYLNAQLAAVTLLLVPAMGLFTWWFMRRVEPLYKRVRSDVGNLNTRLENALSGVELVKTTGTEEYETGRVREASNDLYESNMAVLTLSYFYRPGMELLAGLSFAATFLVGGLWLFQGPPFGLSGTLTVGEFVIFVFLTQRFVEPLSQASNLVDWYENAKASGERVFGLMDVPPHVVEADDAVPLSDVDGAVEYDGVSFGYDDELVLQDIDFEVDPGETVGLVGPTGAGKSTVVKLLLRLYDVNAGQVSIDDRDVREVTVASLRSAIGYVSQDPFLFDGTIAENIRYGRFDASDEAVREAAKAAEAHEFVANLPDGYDTRVGERGVKLSGGQRQRLAIARVVLQDPAILVLDEATSSVDTETEVLIQRSMDAVSADRTTFVIAHRLSTVKDADTILVLEDGSVVERGSHDELLDEDGVYATLWRVQAGEIEALPDRFLESV